MDGKGNLNLQKDNRRPEGQDGEVKRAKIEGSACLRRGFGRQGNHGARPLSKARGACRLPTDKHLTVVSIPKHPGYTAIFIARTSAKSLVRYVEMVARLREEHELVKQAFEKCHCGNLRLLQEVGGFVDIVFVRFPMILSPNRIRDYGVATLVLEARPVEIIVARQDSEVFPENSENLLHSHPRCNNNQAVQPFGTIGDTEEIGAQRDAKVSLVQILPAGQLTCGIHGNDERIFPPEEPFCLPRSDAAIAELLREIENDAEEVFASRAAERAGRHGRCPFCPYGRFLFQPKR